MAVVLSLLVASLCVIKKVSNRQIWAHFLKLFFRDKRRSASRKSMPNVVAAASSKCLWPETVEARHCCTFTLIPSHLETLPFINCSSSPVTRVVFLVPPYSLSPKYSSFNCCIALLRSLFRIPSCVEGLMLHGQQGEIECIILFFWSLPLPVICTTSSWTFLSLCLGDVECLSKSLMVLHISLT